MSNDLIRRSDVLDYLGRQIRDWEAVGCTASISMNAGIATLKEIREVVAEIPAVRPGAIAEAMVVENPEWQLYTEYRGDKPYAYRYGPEWVAMELYMEGGYKTPEEAKLRWLEWWEKYGKEV